MASTLSAVFCAAVAVLFWSVLGFAIMRRLMPDGLALPLSPAAGWAVHSAATLPIFLVLPWSQESVAIVAGALLVAAVAAAQATLPDRSIGPAAMPKWDYLPAALLAMAPAAALLPKPIGDAVFLAAPIFDHAKVAIIDDIAKFGVPAGNPFFGEAGEASRLVYYYLWHFSAAQLAAVTGASGWEADVALTWFTAFSALALMMGLAAWFGGRAGAAILVVVMCAAGSARVPLQWLFGTGIEDTVIGRQDGFAGWLFQSAWVPQHIASASCAVLAIVLMSRLAYRRNGLLVAVLALVVAAGFESSTWIGGVMFAGAAPCVAAVLIAATGPRKSLRFVAALGVAAVAAAMLAAPFLRDQVAAAAMRGTGSPIAFGPYPVLGDDFSDHALAFLDPPAFWLVLLVVTFPAVYPAGAFALAQLLAGRSVDAGRRRLAMAFAALMGASLGVSWLLSSTLADNNDLGWRAVLPGMMLLTVFAAAGLAGWIATRARVATFAAIAALVAGLPGGFELMESYVAGYAQPVAKAFAATPDLWASMRRYTAPDERVADNPLFMAEMTPWPVNISWALLARRRSCYAGRELTLVYSSLSPQRREEIDAQFIRVFAGEAAPDDVKELATRYDCRVVVVTASDGAWSRDPFAASPYYRLAEAAAERWRIYRTVAGAN